MTNAIITTNSEKSLGTSIILVLPPLSISSTPTAKKNNDKPRINQFFTNQIYRI